MRLAVYFAPDPADALAIAGARWLGRDAWSGEKVEQPAIPGLADRTQAPRRYGFHATLKAPFTIKPHYDERDVHAAVAALAGALDAVPAGTLTLSTEPGFLALVPTRASAEVSDLAAACVEALDRFRAPLTTAEIERRRAACLNEHQEQLLLHWGYPYVFDQFRFHLTLSDNAEPATLFDLSVAAWRHFAHTVNRTLVIDSLCLFREAVPGAPFQAVKRFPLGKQTASGTAA
jgi:putative phosphonate metabolism protein